MKCSNNKGEWKNVLSQVTRSVIISLPNPSNVKVMDSVAIYKVIFHLYKWVLWEACKVISINIKGKIEFYDFVMHQKD